MQFIPFYPRRQRYSQMHFVAISGRDERAEIHRGPGNCQFGSMIDEPELLWHRQTTAIEK